MAARCLVLLVLTAALLFTVFLPTTAGVIEVPSVPSSPYYTTANVADALQEVRDHQSDVDYIVELATRGYFRGATYNRLATMTDLIGGRMCSSDPLDEATQWILKQLQEEGFENVHLEKFTAGQWRRGKETALLIKPRSRPFKMPILSLGNSVGTSPEGIEADVVVVTSEAQFNSANVTGKLVLFNYGVFGAGAVLAASKGAVGALVHYPQTRSMRTPHTGISQKSTVPVVCLSMEDVDMLQRISNRGLPISIHLTLDGTQVLPDRVNYNIVADIKGTQKPDEFVIVSGHIDSWDPGNGVMDDAGGAFVSWSVLSLMQAARLRAKRTMRLVMFACEETGYGGALAYFAAHRQEEPNFSVGFESDWGIFKTTGVYLLSRNNNNALRIIQEIGTLLQAINTTEVLPLQNGNIGEDLIEWTRGGLGVPGVALRTVGGNYAWHHHTASDTINIYNPTDLDIAAATWASHAFVAADLDYMLPRPFQSQYVDAE